MSKELTINSRVENISLVENLIDELSVELSLVADIYGNILIAIIEAVTNAIVHGNKLDETKKVTIQAEYQKPYLVVRVTDEGEGFEFNSIPDPTKPDNVEKPDGRGVFLMRHLADDIAFERRGSIVNLKFKIE
jgi:serine/threonine-protein kinase RsbW